MSPNNLADYSIAPLRQTPTANAQAPFAFTHFKPMHTLTLIDANGDYSVFVVSTEDLHALAGEMLVYLLPDPEPAIGSD